MFLKAGFLLKFGKFNVIIFFKREKCSLYDLPEDFQKDGINLSGFIGYGIFTDCWSNQGAIWQASAKENFFQQSHYICLDTFNSE